MSVASRQSVVVDSWVVGKASSHPPDDSTWKAASVLARIMYVCHKIVMDEPAANQESILDEYRRQATSDLTKWWIISVQRQEKMIWRPRAAISIPALTDPDDLKYFQVAVNTPNKNIISEDSDITSIANHNDVTSKGIRIWKLDDALAKL